MKDGLTSETDPHAGVYNCPDSFSAPPALPVPVCHRPRPESEQQTSPFPGVTLGFELIFFTQSGQV